MDLSPFVRLNPSTSDVFFVGLDNDLREGVPSVREVRNPLGIFKGQVSA